MCVTPVFSHCRFSRSFGFTATGCDEAHPFTMKVLHQSVLMLLMALHCVTCRPRFARDGVTGHHHNPWDLFGAQPAAAVAPGGHVAGQGIGELVDQLNGGHFGDANASGAGNGAADGGAAIGQGTGVANVGQGGFGLGLGIGGAIATPLGNIAFGQGESAAVGK